MKFQPLIKAKMLQAKDISCCITIKCCIYTWADFFQQIWEKAPGQIWEKMINLTSKLGEISGIEHNKGSKIYPQNEVILDCIMPSIPLNHKCLSIILIWVSASHKFSLKKSLKKKHFFFTFLNLEKQRWYWEKRWLFSIGNGAKIRPLEKGRKHLGSFKKKVVLNTFLASSDFVVCC